MFSPDSLHKAQTFEGAPPKPKPNSHDMDVVTGPSGLKSNQQPEPTEQESGGWQNGIMS